MGNEGNHNSMKYLTENETLVILTNAKELRDALKVLRHHSPNWPELDSCIDKSEKNIKEIEYFSELN